MRRRRLLMVMCAAVLLSPSLCGVGQSIDEEGQREETVHAGESTSSALTPDEEKFQEMLSGVTLVGHFTMTGQASDEPLREEKYTIAKVTKMRGDYWLFMARIEYGQRDVTVPLLLEVKWAGDTPVITLTDMELPNLGTYTARVLIYRNHYAGMWSGGTHGGHLFGKIVKRQTDGE